MWQGEQTAHFLNLTPVYSFTDGWVGAAVLLYILRHSIQITAAQRCIMSQLAAVTLSRETVTLVVTEACSGGVTGGGGGAAALQLGHGGQLGAGARPASGGLARLPPVPRLGMVTGDQLAVEGVEVAMGLA